MLIPNPLLLDVTPAGGLTLPVTEGRGGLVGYLLLGQHGPPATVEVSTDGGASWQAVTYPHTLAAGETLRWTRTDDSPALTTLRALAPVEEAPPEPEVLTLDNGVPVTVPDLTPGLDRLYTLTLPEGIGELTVTTSGGTGEVDLYVRHGEPPVIPEDGDPVADGWGWEEGNAETVTLPTPAAGTWHVLLTAFEPTSGVTLTATWS
ncbi:hypothetical protein DEIPH_ctg052orf0002 [Deinococcus phoenicis]|uniref:Peptidase C-terminal archaeal/bacterial domain-containing protein n=1 Tax=Deinococcus phoenicis TaxID=1476583 RepID=A0A016QMB4_9DEIO|nr:PPC domain-containing protein [Deinococcus phoenicis]EYB67012.1 hypothetical protein DEIPH_ctg052orf0002 [Deinococcus phoenicis]